MEYRKSNGPEAENLYHFSPKFPALSGLKTVINADEIAY
jgi:hypothetical protein